MTDLSRLCTCKQLPSHTLGYHRAITKSMTKDVRRCSKDVEVDVSQGVGVSNGLRKADVDSKTKSSDTWTTEQHQQLEDQNNLIKIYESIDLGIDD